MPFYECIGALKSILVVGEPLLLWDCPRCRMTSLPCLRDEGPLVAVFDRNRDRSFVARAIGGLQVRVHQSWVQSMPCTSSPPLSLGPARTGTPEVVDSVPQTRVCETPEMGSQERA